MKNNIINFLQIFIVVLIDILLFVHGHILFPSLFFLLVYIGYLIFVSIFLLGLRNLKFSCKLLVLLPTVITISSLSYVLVPYDVAHVFPDGNFIQQLVGFYMSNEKIIFNAGTGEAKGYSFYPFTETLILIFCKITNINSIYVSRLFFIPISLLLFLMLYLTYRQIVKEPIALTASFVTATMYRCSFQLSSLSHPSLAFLFVIMLLLFLFRHQKSISSKLVMLIVALAIAISHNTTAIIVLVIFALYFILKLPFKQYHNFTEFDKSDYGILRFLIIVYLSYNIFIASQYFTTGVVRTLLDFLFNVLFKEPSLIQLFSAEYGFYIHENVTIFGMLIVRPLYYFGYFSTGLFLCILLFDLFIFAHMLFRKGTMNVNTKLVTFSFLSVAVLLLLLTATLLWSVNLVMIDYYHRFLAYTYLFSSPIVVSRIDRLYRVGGKVKWIGIFLLAITLAQSLILTHPVSLFGRDTPFSLEDVRIGPRQALISAGYLRIFFTEKAIYGTRYAFNIIAPYALLEIYQIADFIPKGQLAVVSNVETKILNVTIPVQVNVFYTTGEFSILSLGSN